MTKNGLMWQMIVHNGDSLTDLKVGDFTYTGFFLCVCLTKV